MNSVAVSSFDHEGKTHFVAVPPGVEEATAIAEARARIVEHEKSETQTRKSGAVLTLAPPVVVPTHASQDRKRHAGASAYAPRARDHATAPASNGRKHARVAHEPRRRHMDTESEGSGEWIDDEREDAEEATAHADVPTAQDLSFVRAHPEDLERTRRIREARERRAKDIARKQTRRVVSRDRDGDRYTRAVASATEAYAPGMASTLGARAVPSESSSDSSFSEPDLEDGGEDEEEDEAEEAEEAEEADKDETPSTRSSDSNEHTYSQMSGFVYSEFLPRRHALALRALKDFSTCLSKDKDLILRAQARRFPHAHPALRSYLTQMEIKVQNFANWFGRL